MVIAGGVELRLFSFVVLAQCCVWSDYREARKEFELGNNLTSLLWRVTEKFENRFHI